MRAEINLFVQLSMICYSQPQNALGNWSFFVLWKTDLPLKNVRYVLPELFKGYGFYRNLLICLPAFPLIIVFFSGISKILHEIQKEQYSHLYDIAVSSKDKSTFLALACWFAFVYFYESDVEMFIYSLLYILMKKLSIL